MAKEIEAWWPEFTREIVAFNCSEKVLARGESVFRNGDVMSIVRRGSELQADIAGSEFEPYHIRVLLGRAGIDAAFCSCPYEHGGWCKHIVATMLFAIEAKDEIEIEAPLSELLETVKTKKLLQVLAAMAEDEPAFENILRAYLKGEKPKWPRDYDEYDEWD